VLRGAEDMLLWRHRIENKCSTEAAARAGSTRLSDVGQTFGKASASNAVDPGREGRGGSYQVGMERLPFGLAHFAPIASYRAINGHHAPTWRLSVRPRRNALKSMLRRQSNTVRSSTTWSKPTVSKGGGSSDAKRR
jgi:hypothetical protein